MSIAIGLGSFMNSFDRGYRLGRQMKSDRKTDQQQKELDTINTQGKQTFDQGVKSGQYQADQFENYWQQNILPQQQQFYMKNGDYRSAEALNQWSDTSDARQDRKLFSQFLNFSTVNDHDGMSNMIVKMAEGRGFKGAGREFIEEADGQPARYRFTYVGADGKPFYQDIALNDLAGFGAKYGNPIASYEAQLASGQQAAKRQAEIEDYATKKQIDSVYDTKGNVSRWEVYKHLSSNDPDFSTLSETDRNKRVDEVMKSNTTSSPGIGGMGQMGGGVGIGQQQKPSGVRIVDNELGTVFNPAAEAEQTANGAKQDKAPPIDPKISALQAAPAPQSWDEALVVADKAEAAGVDPAAIRAGLEAFRPENGERGVIPDKFKPQGNERSDAEAQSANWALGDSIFGSTKAGIQKKEEAQAAIQQQQEQAEAQKQQQSANERKQLLINNARRIWQDGKYGDQPVNLVQLKRAMEMQGIKAEDLPDDMKRVFSELNLVDDIKSRSLDQSMSKTMLEGSDEEIISRHAARQPENEDEAKRLAFEQQAMRIMSGGDFPQEDLYAIMKKQGINPRETSPEFKAMLTRMPYSGSMFSYSDKGKQLIGLLDGSIAPEQPPQQAAVGIGNNIPIPREKPVR